MGDLVGGGSFGDIDIDIDIGLWVKIVDFRDHKMNSDSMKREELVN